MFDKVKFANLIRKIKDTYNNQTEFATVAGVNRTYLSQYMNMKLDSPPSPKILQGIALSAKGVTDYDELMEVCGYLTINVTNSLVNSKHFVQIPLFSSLEEMQVYNLDKNIENAQHNFYTSIYNRENANDFFAFKAFDDSMLPLLNVGDIAVIHSQDYFDNGKIHLILLDNKLLFIRKVLALDSIIELHSTNPYYPIIKIEPKSNNFTVLGRVIKIENTSAFK